MRISDWSSDVCSSDLEMMREAGASEVHFRVASPPTAHCCYYGVDTPERSKLLAARMDVEPMREFIKADSLAFISIDGLYRAVGSEARNSASPQFCDACFSGDYRSEEHTSELQSLMRISYAVFCLTPKNIHLILLKTT